MWARRREREVGTTIPSCALGAIQKSGQRDRRDVCGRKARVERDRAVVQLERSAIVYLARNSIDVVPRSRLREKIPELGVLRVSEDRVAEQRVQTLDQHLLVVVVAVANPSTPREVRLGGERIDAGQQPLSWTEPAREAARPSHQLVRDRIGNVSHIAPAANRREPVVRHGEARVERHRAFEVRLGRVP